MDIGTISSRYAKALLRYALECKAEESVYQQALVLSRTMMQVRELDKALLNPVLDKATKLSLLTEAAGGTSHEAFIRFIDLLFRQRRERYLLFILHSFVNLYRRHQRIYVSQLVTAVPLDEMTEQRLRDMIAKATTGTVELDIQVNQDILGGFILQWDNLRLDASVKGQLRQVRKELGR